MNDHRLAHDEPDCPIRVLHVDDDPDFADMSATLLEREDERLSVTTEATASDGLERLAAGEFDCVVSDYEMPGMDGLAFFEAVRAEYADLPFILFTGKGDGGLVTEAISAGVTDYLPKGGGRETFVLLANAVGNAVESARAERRRREHSRQQRTVAELGERALTTLDLDELLEVLADRISETLDVQFVGAFEAEDGELFRLRGGRGWRPDAVGSATVALGVDSDLGASSGEDRSADAGAATSDLSSPLFERHGVVAGLTVAVGSPDDLWGVLGVYSEDSRQFGETDERFLRNVAAILRRLVGRRERVDRLDEKFDQIDDGLVALDGDWQVTYVNEAAATLLSVEKGELLGRDIRDHVSEAFRDNCKKAIRTGEPVRFREHFASRNTWFEVRLFPSETGLSVAVRDVSDQVERERELELKNRAMNEADIGITLTDPSQPDNPVVYANEGFTRLTGYETDAIIGRNCRFLQGPETDPEPVAAMRNAIDDERPITVELRNYRQDGTEFWNQVVITPIEDEDGEVTHFLGFQHDITVRKRVERQLRRDERAYRRLYETASDTDSSFEQQLGRVVEIGRERLDLPIGFLTRIADGTQEIIAARGSHDLLQPGETCPLSEAYCRKTIETDGVLEVRHATDAGWDGDPAYEAFGLECYLGSEVASDGDARWTLCFAARERRAQPFTDSERTLVKLLANWVGATLDRRDYERELERQNRRLAEFADVVAHDLRNPLNVAQGRLELARETGDDDHLEAVADAHDRMTRLVEDVLTLSREGKRIGETTSTSLARVVEDAWASVEDPDASLHLDTEGATLLADESRLRQLLWNLLRNAVEHGGETVSVRVGVLPDEDGFYVADDGPGIPVDEREAVFEYGRSTASDGTGLGLAIVADVADAHGWDSSVVESASGGARFEFTGVDLDIQRGQ